MSEMKLRKANELAEEFGISGVTISRYLRAGSLHGYKVSKAWYCTDEQYRKNQAFLAAQLAREEFKVQQARGRAASNIRHHPPLATSPATPLNGHATVESVVSPESVATINALVELVTNLVGAIEHQNTMVRQLVAAVELSLGTSPNAASVTPEVKAAPQPKGGHWQ